MSDFLLVSLLSQSKVLIKLAPSPGKLLRTYWYVEVPNEQYIPGMFWIFKIQLISKLPVLSFNQNGKELDSLRWTLAGTLYMAELWTLLNIAAEVQDKSGLWVPGSKVLLVIAAVGLWACVGDVAVIVVKGSKDM